MAVIDTHCHLDLVAERKVSVSESFANAGSAGVEAIVQIATGLQSARFNRDLSQSYESVASGDTEAAPALYWTAGLHPEGTDRLHELDELFTLIRAHRDDSRFLGIGETGLDYFHTMEYVAQQKDSFARHLDLAVELKLPVVVHTRDDRMYNPDKVGSITDALAMVQSRPSVRGVLHCFTYTEKEALPFVEQGWMVSYSG
ncbi:MAG: TatD family hydrolase, partial [Leptospiraceae bacterium]|nr:TatD family hydrolase [Leptospiraceae bacterium]